MIKKTSLIFLVLVIHCINLNAVRIRFKLITSNQGLSDSSINCMIQDRQGYLWFGSFDGLNRFDGYNFTTFRKVLGEPNSLRHNAIFALCEDRKGHIWVGTWGGGLSRFDKITEQ
ncbi:MAG: hypothetical protein KAS65_12795, partial [Candidatus Aminicenantes bacterium]|nr:hypothetical protein [Candidatus Aminicenantes bacterium]